MKYTEPSPDEYLNIAEKVRSGEYFREARSMYDLSVNDPMAERYFYVFVTTIALLTFLGAFAAMQSLYPLARTVPFIYALNDVLEDVPSIAPLRSSPHQSVDDAVLFFFAKVYVDEYESYNISKLDRNYSGVAHVSSPEVMAQYQQMLQVSNPESPVVKYERHSVRLIDVASVRKLESPANTLEVVFDATVVNAERSQATRHKAVIAYQYSGVEFDEKADKVKPVTFTVTSYNSKIFQENP
ncbi:MAG: VirB8/TrbF family protein [Alphaproteobacteria bacterium]|nr:VirB8/TrbF family protein [Alphaproteobacteria bacterium]